MAWQHFGRHNMKSTTDNYYLECERHWVFWMLIFVGGYYGAYTFSVRGGVFCNAQTANVVLLALDVGNMQWKSALYMLLPISAYLMGAVVSEILAKEVKLYRRARHRMLRWDTLMVGLEIPMTILLGIMPASWPDQICQVTLNFVCSMRFNTFRQNEGVPMATVFVTNHFRQTGSNLVKAVRDHDHEASVRWKLHASMIASFFLGGLAATILCRFFSTFAIMGVIPVLAAIFIRLAIADCTYEKDLLNQVPRGH